MSKIGILNERTGAVKSYTYEELERITGLKIATLQWNKAMKKKITNTEGYLVNINCNVALKNELLKKFSDAYEMWRKLDLFKVNLASDKKSYYASDLGRIKVVYNSGKEKILCQFTKGRRKRLYCKIAGKEFMVHSIIAKVFLEEKLETDVIYHKNGNIENNKLENLGYINKSKLSRKTASLARAIAVIKLDPETKEELDYYESMRVAGRENFVSADVIAKNIKGIYKSAGGYLWKIDEEFTRSKNEYV